MMLASYVQKLLISTQRQKIFFRHKGMWHLHVYPGQAHWTWYRTLTALPSSFTKECQFLLPLLTHSLCACPSKCPHQFSLLLLFSTYRPLNDILFHKIADETLDELTEFFEDLGDSGLCSGDFDVTMSVSVHVHCIISPQCRLVYVTVHEPVVIEHFSLGACSLAHQCLTTSSHLVLTWLA